jgi:hypothetical protein
MGKSRGAGLFCVHEVDYIRTVICLNEHTSSSNIHVLLLSAKGVATSDAVVLNRINRGTENGLGAEAEVM